MSRSHYKKEFPDYDAKLKVPEGFTDYSYHNDIMPHVEKRIELKDKTFVLKIWQDYVDTDKREYPEGTKRFVLQGCVDNEVEVDKIIFEYSTDNWDEIEYLLDMKNLCNELRRALKDTK